VDDGVDAGPRLRREMRRLLESRVFIMWTGQSTPDSADAWTWFVEEWFWATREIGGERREIFREIESGSRCGLRVWIRDMSMKQGLRNKR
jgi:hypothetical protein